MAKLPKDKAKELVEKMFSLSTTNAFPAKQCALIAVDEIMQANQIWYEDSIPYKYWNEVKKEINKL
jgi:hypothetical protein